MMNGTRAVESPELLLAMVPEPEASAFGDLETPPRQRLMFLLEGRWAGAKDQSAASNFELQ